MQNKLGGEENLSTMIVQAQALAQGCLTALGELEEHLVGPAPSAVQPAHQMGPAPSLTGRMADHVAGLEALNMGLNTLLNRLGGVRQTGMPAAVGRAY